LLGHERDREGGDEEYCGEGRCWLQERYSFVCILYRRSNLVGERPSVRVLWVQVQGVTRGRASDVDMRCCRQEDADVFCLVVAESAFLLLGRCKYRKDVSVVCVSTSVSDGSKLGSCYTAIWYAGQLLRWTEVVSYTSLLCVVSVLMVNRVLYSTQSRDAERESRVMGRGRELCVSLR
jgi:hypothetical protein